MNRYIFLKFKCNICEKEPGALFRYVSCSLIRVFVIYRSLKGTSKIHQILTNITMENNTSWYMLIKTNLSDDNVYYSTSFTYRIHLILTNSIDNTIQVITTNIKQELPILPEHLSSPPVFSGVRVTRSLVLCVCFVDSFFVLLYFFFWPLCSSSIYGF